MTNDVKDDEFKGVAKGVFTRYPTLRYLHPSQLLGTEEKESRANTQGNSKLGRTHRWPSCAFADARQAFLPRQHCSACIELSTAREDCGALIGQQSSLLRQSAGSRSGKRRETTVFSDGLSRLGIGASPNQNGCQSAVPNCNRASESSSVFRLAQLASFMSLNACR
jgi:hypothetical protein